MIKLLAESKKHQFVITTHSTVFASPGKGVKVFHVRKSEGASVPREIRDLPSLRQLKQSLRHDNTDLFGYNAVVLIEGDTEEVAFPIISEHQGIDFVEQGVKLQSIHGSGKSTRIGELLEYLKAADVPLS